MASIIKADVWQNSAGSTYGTVLRVTQNNLTGRYSQSFSQGVATDLTDFNVTVTPTSASSKFLIMVRWMGEWNNAGLIYNSVAGLKRNGTRIGEQENPSGTVMTGLTTMWRSYENADANSTPEGFTFTYLDSPATTNSVTYQVWVMPDSAGVLYTNRMVGWGSQAYGYELGTSTILVMEIAS